MVSDTVQGMEQEWLLHTAPVQHTPALVDKVPLLPVLLLPVPLLLVLGMELEIHMVSLLDTEIHIWVLQESSSLTSTWQLDYCSPWR